MRAALALIFALAATVPVGRQEGPWTSSFPVPPSDLRPTGRNPYFVLEPGHSSTLADGDERLVITVLDEIRRVDGVDTRVVEERETKAGALVEVSRNYFAISRAGDVYYFGEAVDIYRNGRVVDHEGAWESGRDGARFGLMMPAQPRVGQQYYQEVAPRIALDRATVVGASAVVRTPAGEFRGCLKVEETTPLEPNAREYKYYAKGVGLVQDGELKLVRRP